MSFLEGRRVTIQLSQIPPSMTGGYGNCVALTGMIKEMHDGFILLADVESHHHGVGFMGMENVTIHQLDQFLNMNYITSIMP